MYICTFPRMQPLKIRCAVFSAFMAATFLMSLPSFAQDARTHGSGAQANLRISVNVVSAVTPHRRHQDRDRDDDAVSYDLNRPNQELSITREVRAMLVEVQGAGARLQPVQLTTVVVQ